MTEYEIFVSNDLSDLIEGEGQIVKVRNMENYEMRVVKAELKRPGINLTGAHRLWVRRPMGLKLSDPWTIKIHEDLGSIPDYVGVYQEWG
ncbi:MAG: hypothetical protein SV775_08205 [Thermodesulfobacteriota bacterium]|nr:hypothetical protein [Thermodesulfobacteriota bacterium]